MIKIMFVCHGNICRSPMAEFIMKKLVKDAGLENKFFISSSATSTEEIGNSVYYKAKSKLSEHGISPGTKTAVRLTKQDYDEYDYIIGMDSFNIRNILRIIENDSGHKVYKLLSFAGKDTDVADPWYTDDFDTAYDNILTGCTALLKKLKTHV